MYMNKAVFYEIIVDSLFQDISVSKGNRTITPFKCHTIERKQI